MSTTPRLLSIRLLLTLLCAALVVVALSTALSPGSGGHSATVGSAHQSSGVSPTYVDWE